MKHDYQMAHARLGKGKRPFRNRKSFCKRHLKTRTKMRKNKKLVCTHIKVARTRTGSKGSARNYVLQERNDQLIVLAYSYILSTVQK